MSRGAARLIAGAILTGAGGIAFALGDQTAAANFRHDVGKYIGAILSVIGLAMMLSSSRADDSRGPGDPV